jgi:hypothetical protein
MTLPYQEHNSLLACREFLLDLTNPEKIPNVSDNVRLNAKYLLKYYPSRSRLKEIYEGNTIEDIYSNINKENPNRIINDNQTWDTPGFKWKTEVEFIPANNN